MDRPLGIKMSVVAIVAQIARCAGDQEDREHQGLDSHDGLPSSRGDCEAKLEDALVTLAAIGRFARDASRLVVFVVVRGWLIWAVLSMISNRNSRAAGAAGPAEPAAVAGRDRRSPTARQEGALPGH